MANCEHYDRGICQIGIANMCPFRHGCNKPKNKEDIKQWQNQKLKN